MAGITCRTIDKIEPALNAGAMDEENQYGCAGQGWIKKQAPEGRLFVYSSFAALRGDISR